MTPFEKAKAETVIQLIAVKENKPLSEILQAMQEALDAAWAAAWTPGNICAQTQWCRLFGAQKPSVEEFISVLANEIA